MNGFKKVYIEFIVYSYKTLQTSPSDQRPHGKNNNSHKHWLVIVQEIQRLENKSMTRNRNPIC